MYANYRVFKIPPGPARKDDGGKIGEQKMKKVNCRLSGKREREE